MAKVIESSREEVSENAPRFITLQVKSEKVETLSEKEAQLSGLLQKKLEQ